MPSPRSSISTARPLATSAARTVTGLGAGEYTVALSISSASRWITSATEGGASDTSSSVYTSTRWYSATSPTALRRMSISATGSLQVRPGRSPLTMTRFSSYRRSWLATESRSYRPLRTSGSVCLRSSASSLLSWRLTRFWLCRAMPRMIFWKPRRVSASSTAVWTAVRCAVLNACATCPSSS